MTVVPISCCDVVAVHDVVPIESLRLGESLRSMGEDEQHIAVLAECADRLPPILVDPGSMLVIDGVHRLRAARRRGVEQVEIEYFHGSSDDAFIAAVERNTAHGLPLSRSDRLRAAARIIASRPHWSNRVIAAKVGLSDKTVGVVRERSSANIPQTNVRLGKDGRLRPSDTSKGRTRAAEFIAANPSASLREIAAASGIAIATARDVRMRLQDGNDPTVRRAGNSRKNVVQSEQSSDVMDEVAALSKVLSRLRNDPALRFNEAGRLVLRLLDAHHADGRDWADLMDKLPPHCVTSLADAAHRCMQVWQFVEANLRTRCDES
jgi:ParB-like chromosome segregation protein Spo0J